MADRISMLSDELLCHILSFLPTQQAVTTSVLSKRWKPLWISVPILNYDEEIYLSNNEKPHFSFERFVYATILARDFHQQPITSFRLKYGVSCAPPNVGHRNPNADVNVWLNTVVRRGRGIDNLEIDMFSQNYINLSCCIFSCRTLVVLKLNRLFLSDYCSVELPSLKSLHLVQVEFVEPQNLLELLYGCPVLEYLETDDIYYVEEAYFSEEGFKILPKLVTADLHFVGVCRINIILKAMCNVEVLSIKQSEVEDGVPEFSNVRHLSLFVDTHNWNWVLLMLKNCPKLQSLELDLLGSFDVEDVLPCSHYVVPECLTSHFTKCYLKLYSGTKSNLQFAKYIMGNSTSLLSMTIHSVSSNPLKQLEELQDLALCPRRSALCQLSFSFQ